MTNGVPQKERSFYFYCPSKEKRKAQCCTGCSITEVKMADIRCLVGRGASDAHVSRYALRPAAIPPSTTKFVPVM